VEFVEQNRQALADLNLAWLEEPVFPPEDFASPRRLRAGPAPIAAGKTVYRAPVRRSEVCLLRVSQFWVQSMPERKLWENLVGF
jgi:hypothetical protein